MSADHSTAPRAHHQPFGLRSHLYVLIAAALIPMLVLGGFTMWLAADRLKEDSGRRLLETAGILAHAVDRSMAETMSNLQLFITSLDDSVDSRSATQLWRRFQHSGPDSRILFHHDEDAGTLVAPALLAEAQASGNPQISSLYFAEERPDAPLVAIVVADGQAGSGLTAALIQRSNHLIDAIATSSASQSLLIAVVDNTGRIAARSRNPERFLGRPVPDWDTLTAMGMSNGLFDAKTAEGGQIKFAFQMLENAPGWALVVGEPAEAFQARWQGPLIGIGVGGLIAALIALLTSHHLANRILQPLRALTRRSMAVAGGQDYPYDEEQQSSIREFASLQDTITHTETALQQRAQDAHDLADRLEGSQRLYRAVAEVGALVFWQAHADGEAHTLTGWNDLTGQSDAQAQHNGWMQAVHPDDLGQLKVAWQQSLQHKQPMDVEFRVRCATGEWRWVRSRGVPVGLDTDNEQEWAGVLEDVDARRQAQAHIQYLAHHDPLTGLANRSVLMERLQHLIASDHVKRGVALLCVDLDRFKEVNDTLGHPKGDALLCAVAERMRNQVRKDDLIARLGGDEFAIIQSATRQPDSASGLASRLLETLRLPYDLDGMHATVGVSIGIAIAEDSSTTPERLFQNADLALYRVKEEGRGHFRFFEPEMNADMQARRQLELDLRQAFLDQEFELHYQPLVDLKHRQLKGFEALLRWNHPQRGLLPPRDFLPVLEEIGLMPKLGQWVLKHACEAARQWPDNLKVSVNLASSQLDGTLHTWVLEQLAETQLSPSRLELEVTENALIANIEAVSASLLKLKLAGVSIVMDNFGTGYSSIGYLRSFPFDKVKIDRSFVRDLGVGQDGAAVISAVTNLCAKLGITTVVEGVETQSQLALIGENTCDEAQGYLFGRPMPAAKILELLEKGLDAPELTDEA